MNKYIKEEVFKDNPARYQELVELNQSIKQLKIMKRPFLIEVLGTTRSGKTTSIELIADVLRKNGLKVSVIDEEKVKITKSINENRNQKMNVDSLNYTNTVIESKILFYDTYHKEDSDIIIFDRGINDEFIWLDTFGASKEEIKAYHDRLKNRMVDFLVMITCDAETSIKRKYLNLLSVEPSKWTNFETLNKYLDAMTNVSEYLDKHSKKMMKIDSSKQDKITVALNICKQILEAITNN